MGGLAGAAEHALFSIHGISFSEADRRCYARIQGISGASRSPVKGKYRNTVETTVQKARIHVGDAWTARVVLNELAGSARIQRGVIETPGGANPTCCTNSTPKFPRKPPYLRWPGPERVCQASGTRFATNVFQVIYKTRNCLSEISKCIAVNSLNLEVGSPSTRVILSTANRNSRCWSRRPTGPLHGFACSVG